MDRVEVFRALVPKDRDLLLAAEAELHRRSPATFSSSCRSTGDTGQTCTTFSPPPAPVHRRHPPQPTARANYPCLTSRQP